MNTKVTQLSLILATFGVLLLAGCTENRAIEKKTQNVVLPQAQGISAVADVQFNQQPFEAMQMTIKGGYLYVTGTAMFFSKWDITSDPESPHLSFYASKNATSADSTSINGPSPDGTLPANPSV